MTAAVGALLTAADCVMRRPQVSVAEIGKACEVSTRDARGLMVELERWRVIAPAAPHVGFRKPILMPRYRPLVERLIRQHGGVVPHPNPLAMRTVPGITAQERVVLDLVAEGLDNQQIGRLLFISRHTVNTHVKRMCQQLEACNRTHLVSLGYQLGHLPNPYKKQSGKDGQ